MARDGGDRADDATGAREATDATGARESTDADERAREADADARALASVVRWRILRLCLDEPLTNREIAARLRRDPGTTYHHVRTLADRGFLAAQPERRGERGAREVPYLATRKTWRAGSLGPLVDRMLVDTFLEELSEADPASVDLGRLGVVLDEDGRAELGRRMTEVLNEFAGRPPAPGGTPYSIFLAVHEDAARRRR